jgi:hypothetical protein
MCRFLQYTLLLQIIIIIIIIIQGIGHSRPIPIQNLTSELHEIIWTNGRTPWTGISPT